MGSQQMETRRRWLMTCAGATAGIATLAGCTSDNENGDDESEADGETPDGFDEGDAGEYGVWPMAHYDAANTAVAPNSGPDSKPDEEWSVELESSPTIPVVANGTVFVGERGGKYRGIDIQTGDVLWNHNPDVWEDTRGEPNSAFTPAVSDTAVYVPGNGVEALEHSGEELWESGHDTLFNLRIHDKTIYGRTSEYVYGIDEESGKEILKIEASTEIETLSITDEKIILATRQDEEDFQLEGYEKRTGDQLWTQMIQEIRGGAPDIRIIDSSVYTVNYMEVISIDTETGDVEVLNDFLEKNTRPSQPTVHAGRAYIPTELPEIPVLDIDTGEQIPEWDKNILNRMTGWRMMIADEVLYVWSSGTINSPGHINAIDIKTNEKKWEIESTLSGIPVGPIIIEDAILYADNSDNTVVFYE